MNGLVNLSCLLKSQWNSNEKIELLQSRKLRRLIKHAYYNVPYYHRLFEKYNLKPEEINGIGDLQKIPLTSKKDIQELPINEITAHGTDLKQCINTRTSGATGRPLEIIATKKERAMMNPSFIRAYMAWGLMPWHRLMYFQARKEYMNGKSWYEIFSLLKRKILCTADEPDIWIEDIKNWRPHLLQGYTLTLKLLADAVKKRKNEGIHIPLIVNTSGMLDSHGRRLLEAVFNARVIDVYASEEAGSVIAWECPECTGYHINSDTVIVEFLKNGQPAVTGKEGEIVITNLQNFTMPFIRYQQDDTGIYTSDEPICGRGLPLMKEICGRSNDYVILPDGKKLTPHLFSLAMDDIAGIGEWKLLQKNIDEIEVEISVRENIKEEILEEVRRNLNRIIGDKMKIKIKLVKEIRRDPYQKLRSVVSEVKE